MAAEWYVTRDGKKLLGPYTSEQLRQLANAGKLKPTDMLRKGQGAKWAPANQITTLFDPPPAKRLKDAWYVARDKEKIGPYSLEHLRRLATSGLVLPNDMVRQEGTTKWVAAKTVPALFQLPKAHELCDRVYLRQEGKGESGPFTTMQLRLFAHTGQLRMNDEMRREGIPQWLPVGWVDDLFTPLSAQELQNRWYIRKTDGKEAGPFVLSQLQLFVATGKLTPGDQVSQVEQPNDWVPAGRMSMLFGTGERPSALNQPPPLPDSGIPTAQPVTLPGRAGSFVPTAVPATVAPSSQTGPVDLIICPHCNGYIPHDEASAGSLIPCPHCGQQLLMSVGSSTANGASPTNPFDAIPPEERRPRTRSNRQPGIDQELRASSGGHLLWWATGAGFLSLFLWSVVYPAAPFGGYLFAGGMGVVIGLFCGLIVRAIRKEAIEKYRHWKADWEQCPACHAPGAGDFLRVENLACSTTMETRTFRDDHYNREGERVGHTNREGQVAVTHATNAYHYRCRHCRHVWSKVASDTDLPLRYHQFLLERVQEMRDQLTH